MHRYSPISSCISQSCPISNTPPVNETCSPPPPNYNLHITPQNNLSPRHSQSAPLSSPPYFHISPLPDDTNCDNSSNDSPYTIYGNQQKFILLLQHQFNLMTFR